MIFLTLSVLGLGQFLSVGFATAVLAAATVVALIARATVSFKESLQMFADARVEAQTDSLTSLGPTRRSLRWPNKEPVEWLNAWRAGAGFPFGTRHF